VNGTPPCKHPSADQAARDYEADPTDPGILLGPEGDLWAAGVVIYEIFWGKHKKLWDYDQHPDEHDAHSIYDAVRPSLDRSLNDRHDYLAGPDEAANILMTRLLSWNLGEQIPVWGDIVSGGWVEFCDILLQRYPLFSWSAHKALLSKVVPFNGIKRKNKVFPCDAGIAP
jgi:hypothetical protein